MFIRVYLVFSPLSKLIPPSFHPSMFIQLDIRFFFLNLLSMRLFVGLENDLVISGHFVYHSLLGLFTDYLNLFFSWSFPSIFKMIFKKNYKVGILFLFHPSLFYFSFEFSSHSFYYYLFYLRWIFKIIFICLFSLGFSTGFKNEQGFLKFFLFVTLYWIYFD